MTGYPSRHGTVEVDAVSITEKLFEGLVGREDETAITDGPTGRALTAGALMERIKRLAGGLTERGILPGGTVAILAPNMPEYPIVFHAVAWGGGTVTTINPTYTAPEIHHQLVDAGASILVTIPAFVEAARAAAEGTGVKDIVIIGAEKCLSLEDVMGQPLEAQAPVDLETHVVVLPYSSGTTGRPKGVMLTHRNLVANVQQSGAVAGITARDTAIAFLPFFHIYGMTVLMNLFLERRAKLVTMPRFELELFLRLIQEHQATRLYIVPPVALGAGQAPDGGRVRHVLGRGSVFRRRAAGPRDRDRGGRAAGRAVGAGLRHDRDEPDQPHDDRRQRAPRLERAGGALDGVPDREPRDAGGHAPGEEGELWVRGPQVMKGYLNNPDATAETLTEDGWLRTGDLAIIDADGFMFIRDRLKELIKYKGFQVAPAEVEAALIAHEGVVDAAVIGKPDEEAGEAPVAFVVRAPGSEVGEDDLKAHCEGCLAHYKHPVEYRFVESVPKSASARS
jgi:acyl-CoA synthetase (AMP-forming)/AMP-acid ligase II